MNVVQEEGCTGVQVYRRTHFPVGTAGSEDVFNFDEREVGRFTLFLTSGI